MQVTIQFDIEPTNTLGEALGGGAAYLVAGTLLQRFAAETRDDASTLTDREIYLVGPASPMFEIVDARVVAVKEK